MGIIKRFRKINHNTSLSLGKLRIGGFAIAFILIIGLGWKVISKRLNLPSETFNLVNEVVGCSIAVLFVSIVAVKLARLSARNRWAMICLLGCSSLVGALMGVLLNLNEEHKGLSEYFPYDVILYCVAAVGGYIAWRIHTTRLLRIKLDRENRIKRHRRNAM